MSRWFRFYEDAIHDAKLLRLPDDLFRAWTILLCFASKNDGVLPPADDIAIALRIKPTKVCEWITKLVRGGLLDRVGNDYAPHNWNGRQYKSDVSTERVKRFRNGKRNVSETPPETEQIQITEQIDDDAGAAPATGALVSPEAMVLSEKLLVIAGHDPKFWPPGWCGAPMRVQTWLTQGWKPEIIVAAVKGAAARKRGSPANSVQFFENAIAEEVARQATPLPTVEIREAEKVISYGASKPKSGGSLIEALDRQLAELGKENADLAAPAYPVLRISR